MDTPWKDDEEDEEEEEDVFEHANNARSQLLQRSLLLTNHHPNNNDNNDDNNKVTTTSSDDNNANLNPTNIHKVMTSSDDHHNNDLFGGIDLPPDEEDEDEDLPFANNTNNNNNTVSNTNKHNHEIVLEEDPLQFIRNNNNNIKSKNDEEEKDAVVYRDHSTINMNPNQSNHIATNSNTPMNNYIHTNINNNNNNGIYSNHQQQQQQQNAMNYLNTPASPAMASGMNTNNSMTHNNSTNSYANALWNSTSSSAISNHNMSYNNYADMNHHNQMITAQQQSNDNVIPTMSSQPQLVLPEIQDLTLLVQDMPPSKFKNIKVQNPILIHNGGGFLSSKHFWSFEVISEMNLEFNGKVPNVFLNGQQYVSVRRRFRHFCALEERLKLSAMCCGSILPPRPDKYIQIGLEHHENQQTEEFALRRAQELQEYMNLLVQHPKAGHTEELTLFLTLSDDIGTAWPDVSVNAFTRLTEGTHNLMKTIAGDNPAEDMYHGESAAEDDATLLALSCQESLRIGVVSQAVPKLEGAVVLLKEHSEKSGNVGMEMNRVIVNANSAGRAVQRQLQLGPKVYLETFSNAMIKSGRRSKVMSTNAASALKPFHYQLKICPNIRNGFSDRRKSLTRKIDLRDIADEKAHRLLSLQYQMNSSSGISGVPVGTNIMHGGMHNNPYSNDSYANSFTNLQAEIERMEMEAAVGDEEATTAATKATETGVFLKQEVGRLALLRKTEWMASMKSLALSMRDAAEERKNIWETALGTLNSLDE